MPVPHAPTGPIQPPVLWSRSKVHGMLVRGAAQCAELPSTIAARRRTPPAAAHRPRPTRPPLHQPAGMAAAAAAPPPGGELQAEAFQRLYPDQYLAQFVTRGLRPDGRPLALARPTSIGLGVVSTADASALVKLGSTSVLAGVKAEVMPAPADTPDRGRLTLQVGRLVVGGRGWSSAGAAWCRGDSVAAGVPPSAVVTARQLACRLRAAGPAALCASALRAQACPRSRLCSPLPRLPPCCRWRWHRCALPTRGRGGPARRQPSSRSS